MHDSVWQPAKWNGRFQGIGGSGYSSAATDCGLPQAYMCTGAWALGSDGQLDWPLINDYA